MKLAQFDRSVTDPVHLGATSHRSRGPCTGSLGRRPREGHGRRPRAIRDAW